MVYSTYRQDYRYTEVVRNTGIVVREVVRNVSSYFDFVVAAAVVIVVVCHRSRFHFCMRLVTERTVTWLPHPHASLSLSLSARRYLRWTVRWTISLRGMLQTNRRRSSRIENDENDDDHNRKNCRPLKSSPNRLSTYLPSAFAHLKSEIRK